MRAGYWGRADRDHPQTGYGYWKKYHTWDGDSCECGARREWRVTVNERYPWRLVGGEWNERGRKVLASRVHGGDDWFGGVPTLKVSLPELSRVLKGMLKPEEECTLRLVYCEHLSLRKAGLAVQRTPERLRQVEAKALRKLRHPTRRLQLWDYPPIDTPESVLT